MKIPNFFIIGAPKCGTTALAHYLAEHDRVFFAVPKEPAYWSTDYPGQRRLLRIDTPEAYLALFRDADDSHLAVGEGSTDYLSSREAVRNILDFNPEARFIALLRDPVQVVHAFHQESLFNFREDVRDFERAWALQGERAAGRSLPPGTPVPQYLQYGEMARFGAQLDRFFELVPEDRRRVFLHEDLVRDTAGVYREVLEFLGLPDDGRSEFPKLNEAKSHRFRGFGRLMLHPPAALSRPVTWIKRRAQRYPDGLLGKARQWLRVREARSPLRPEFEAELRRYFAPDVERAAALLGRDLSAWVTGAPAAGHRQVANA